MGVRAKNHNRSNQLPVYSADTSLGWSVARWASIAKGDEMALAGKWRAERDGFGALIGYRIIASHQRDEEIPSKPSSAGIVRREMEINAGLRGVSRTAGMSEDKRLGRKNLRSGKAEPEDAVERVQAKVRVYGNVGSKSKDILRVWPR